MKKVLLASAVLLAIGTSYAQNNIANLRVNGNSNDVDVEQSGRNTANVNMQSSGNNNEVDIRQIGGTGARNVVSIATVSGGDHNNNKADYYQAGDNNGSYWDIAGSRNDIKSRQEGNANFNSFFLNGGSTSLNTPFTGGVNNDRNEVDFKQQGTSNHITGGAQGDRNKVKVTQAGERNFVLESRDFLSTKFKGSGVYAVGNSNEANIRQEGSDNLAMSGQRGNNNESKIVQLGQWNDAKVMQQGNRNQSDVDQRGSYNSVNLKELGDDNEAKIDQRGSYNKVKGYEGDPVGLIDGNDNKVTIFQAGVNHETNLKVLGNSNVVNVTQN